jgi:hypothetical protein
MDRLMEVQWKPNASLGFFIHIFHFPFGIKKVESWPTSWWRRDLNAWAEISFVSEGRQNGMKIGYMGIIAISFPSTA